MGVVIVGFDGGEEKAKKGERELGGWNTGVMGDEESSEGERKEWKIFHFFTDKHERKKKKNWKPRNKRK